LERACLRHGVLAKKAQGICVDWVCSLIQICCSRPISKQFGGSWGEHRYVQRGYGSSRLKRLAPKQVQPLFGGKKSGRFGTSNNIISLAFTFFINRTQKVLVTYYNSCKIRLPFYILVVSYSFKNVTVFLVFTQGPTSAILFSAKESTKWQTMSLLLSISPSFILLSIGRGF